MVSFEYKIKDPLGLHARPAGQLVKEAKAYKSKVTIYFGGQHAEAQRMIAVMSLGIKQNDIITVTVEGEDEEQALLSLQKFFTENI